MINRLHLPHATEVADWSTQLRFWTSWLNVGERRDDTKTLTANQKPVSVYVRNFKYTHSLPAWGALGINGT